MLAIRVPCSALGGALLSAALFLGLWQLVNVPMVAGQRLPQVIPELARVRPETPEQTTRVPRPEREPPLAQPDLPRISTGESWRATLPIALNTWPISKEPVAP